MESLLSEALAQLPAACGVKRVYCSAAGSALHAGMSTAWQLVPVCHAESALFAAAAEAQLTGIPGLCCVSGETELLSLLAALAEARSIGAPVVVLLPELKNPCMGPDGAGVEHRTDALLCALGVETLCPDSEEWVFPALLSALRTAQARRCPVVLSLPARLTAGERTSFVPMGDVFPLAHAAACPAGESLMRLAELINRSARVTFLCGIGCAGAKHDVVALARRVQAPIAYTLRAKDVMEGDNPCEVGMTGCMGWGGAPVAVSDCDLLILWGTDFPQAEYLPKHAAVAQVDMDAAALGRRSPLTLGVHGDVREVARALLPLIRRDRGDEHLAAARCHHRRCVASMEQPVRAPDEEAPLRAEYITRLVSDLAEPDAVVLVETGSPMLWAARYLRAADARRLLGSFRLGSDSCALAMAIGAKAAFPSRQVIALCHTEGLSRLSGLLQTMRARHLSVKILLYRQSGQGGSAPHDVAALARSMGLAAERLSEAEHAGAAVKQWLAEHGPALLEVLVAPDTSSAPPSLSLQR